MEISSLKINDFRGLHSLSNIEFSEINIIASAGNFGKTTIIQAIIAAMNFNESNRILRVSNIFKNHKYSDFEYFKQLMFRCTDNTYIYDLEADFLGTYITKKIIGDFCGCDCFKGEYTATIKNEDFSFCKKINEKIEFSNNTEEKYNHNGLCCPQFAIFDFEKAYEYPSGNYKNNRFKEFLINYIRHFDENIREIIWNDNDFYIKYENQEMSLFETLGSRMKKCLEFSLFCDKNKGKVLFIENADTNYCEETREFYIKLLLSHIVNCNSQVFITSKSRSFGKRMLDVMWENKLSHKACYINLLKPEDEILVECEKLKYDWSKEIFGSK